MKANEITIGDWVHCITDNVNHRIAEISILDRAEVLGHEYYRTEEGTYNFITDIEGIPLTKEILEKNGFERVLDEDGTECYRYYNSAADGYIKTSLYNGGDGDWSIEIVNYEKFDDNKIVYNNNFIFLTVHELQHALRLCGIEKTIEL